MNYETDYAKAKAKFDKLLNMTVARGCTPHEAATAQRLAKELARKWAFVYDIADEAAKAAQFGWEYRKCGNRNCRCAKGHPHGPYVYTKERRGRTVRSVYKGRADKH